MKNIPSFSAIGTGLVMVLVVAVLGLGTNAASAQMAYPPGTGIADTHFSFFMIQVRSAGIEPAAFSLGS